MRTSACNPLVPAARPARRALPIPPPGACTQGPGPRTAKVKANCQRALHAALPDGSVERLEKIRDVTHFDGRRHFGWEMVRDAAQRLYGDARRLRPRRVAYVL